MKMKNSSLASHMHLLCGKPILLVEIAKRKFILVVCGDTDI